MLADSSVKCWGDNAYGQLGNGSTTSALYSAPVAASGITNAVDVVTGKYHTGALLSDQTIKCWGANSSGQLGNGTNIQSLTPVSVSGITAVTALVSSSSSLHTCAVGSVSGVLGMKCWGDNANYQINSSTTPYLTTPFSAVY